MSTGLRFTLEVDGLPPDAFAVGNAANLLI
ncbi:ybl66 [Escherichia coli]|uniref:Ybl66 n=1 Tax=Escherichia coli TaxID=562 RepID=A0A376FSH2_ECOLX|nr:ybl66 [Escherichia coli]